MPHSTFRILLLFCCAAALSACHKPAAKPAASAGVANAPATAGYAAPPELVAAEHSAAGGIELKGTSRPDAQIRLISPDGTALAAVADHAGSWELRAPSVDPHLFALAEQAGGRLIRSRGYVLILPAPGIAAVVLRPGTGPRPFGGPRPQPVITAVDLDRGGAGVISGVAGAGEVLRVQVDGTETAEGRSDANGAFSVALADQLKPGAHSAVVRAQTDKGLSDPAQASFEVGPPTLAFVPPLSAQRTDTGWRLDWLTPGGGVQTTIAFDTEPRA